MKYLLLLVAVAGCATAPRKQVEASCEFLYRDTQVKSRHREVVTDFYKCDEKVVRQLVRR